MDLSGVRAKIADGALPQKDRDRTRLMLGARGTCFVCEQATSPVDMTVECYRAKVIFTLHPDCYVIWEEARRLEA